MIDLLVGTVFVIAIACAASVLGYWWQCYQYDRWIEEFNRRGIKTALEPVFQGSEVVGYTLVHERPSKAL